MIPSMTQHACSQEQKQWADYYKERLPLQLRQVTAFVSARYDKPDMLRPHLRSCLLLLEATADRHDLSALWVALVDALHPLPLRWGFWSPWLDILRQAASKAANLNRPALQAEYLAYTAALLSETALAETALSTAREALDCAHRAGDAYSIALAGSKIMAALHGLGRFAEAQDTLTSAKEAMNSAASSGAIRDAHGRALLQIEEMDLMRHFGRLPEALALGEQLVATLKAIPDLDLHEFATALRRRATILWAAGQYAAAAADLTRSAELFRQVGDPLGAVFSEGNLGLVYFSMGDLDLAEAIKVRAVRAAEDLNAGWWLVRDLGELSGIYMYRGQLDTTLVYCRRHVELARLYNDERQLAQARDNRGVTLMLLGRYEEAHPDIEAALSYFQEHGPAESLVAATLDMALYLRSVNEPERAALLAEENFSRARQLGYPVLHMLTSRCLAMFKSRDDQVRLLQEALALAREHDRKMDIAGSLFSLSAITGDAAEGDRLYDQAALMLREMGTEGWLIGHSRDNPPHLPLLL